MDLLKDGRSLVALSFDSGLVVFFGAVSFLDLFSLLVSLLRMVLIETLLLLDRSGLFSLECFSLRSWEVNSFVKSPISGEDVGVNLSFG